MFFDGTWNTVGDNTNVWRLKSLCSARGGDGANQIFYYDVGVNGLRGGTTGKGLSDNVADAYKWLVDLYEPDDEIFVFGFSRGAYTARALTGLVTKCGLLKRGAPLGVNQLYERYRRSHEPTVWELRRKDKNGELKDPTLEERWLLTHSQAVNIKFVGVWDTVGALGVPAFHISGISRSTFGFLHTGLRRPIKNAFHALAIDEHRRAFRPTLWTVRMPLDPSRPIPPPRPISSVEQRWFVGAHANVGGGYSSDALAQLPLQWIMSKAALHGLRFTNALELDDASDAPICDSHKEFMYGVYSKFSSRYYRPIGPPPDEKPDGIHSNVNETIDASVFTRWQNFPEYRPRNLADWAVRRQVNIMTLDKSVRADTPDVSAPD